MNFLTLISASIIGFLVVFFFSKNTGLNMLEKAESKAKELLNNSEKERKEILDQAAKNLQKKKGQVLNFSTKKEQLVSKQKSVLNRKEQSLDSRLSRNKKAKDQLESLKSNYQNVQKQNSDLTQQIIKKLLTKTGLNQEDLQNEVVNSYTQGIIQDSKERIAKHEEYVKENAEKIAKKELWSVIQRLNALSSDERRSLNIKVPKDYIKGKVFGENGKNIIQLEKHFDVDIVFNDLPNTISVSAFNLVERKKAAKAIEKLVAFRNDITPEVVTKQIELSEKEVNVELFNIGKKALTRMGITHNDEKFIRTVGRLQYRTSYGQNIMNHCMEVGWVGRMLASAIGLNEKTALIGGFLHDVGKAIDQKPNEKDTHDLLSKQIMEEAGFSWEETHAAWVHHDAIPQETAEAHLVKAADAVSAARPGARQESFEKYLERIKDLEAAAKSFKFVERAFALSAGRELRVNVNSKKTDDESIKRFAKELAHKIEDEIVYPGQVKVNVIRRTEFKDSTKKNEKKAAKK